MIHRLITTTALLTAATALVLTLLLAKAMDTRLEELENLPVAEPPMAVEEGEKSA